jgi:hypothetical protein
LYKHVRRDDIKSYDKLYANIKRDLMDFFLSMIENRDDVYVSKSYDIKEGMNGEIDLLIGNTIIDYKTSINDDISIQWILQLLCYKVLHDFNNPHDKKVEKIAVMNPLRGWYSYIDVSAWNKHHELVSYLLKKRDSKRNLEM